MFRHQMFRSRSLRVGRILTLFSVVALLQAQTSDGAAANIHVTFLECSGDQNRANTPKLFLLDEMTYRHVENTAQYTFTRTSLGFDADIHLVPGFYDLGVIDGRCSDEAVVPVLKGHNREALLIGWQGLMVTGSSAMIAGTAPFSGYSASIVYYPHDQKGHGPSSLVVIPAKVERDAYYATGVPFGIARLRISTVDGTHSLEFMIGEIGAGSSQRNVLFNVSASDVEIAATKGLRP